MSKYTCELRLMNIISTDLEFHLSLACDIGQRPHTENIWTEVKWPRVKGSMGLRREQSDEKTQKLIRPLSFLTPTPLLWKKRLVSDFEEVTIVWMLESETDLSLAREFLAN